MNVQCPCCNGTGMIEAGGGQSQTALLRAELARVWGVVKILSDFATAHMEETAVAITGLVGELGGVRGQLHSQNEEISSLQKRLAIHSSWNCRTSDNPEHYEAIKNYREASQQYQAALGAEPTSDQTRRAGVTDGVTPEGDGREGTGEETQDKETRRQFRRRAAKHENGTEPKKAGGQPNHTGSSRTTKPESTMCLAPELCMMCGTVPDIPVRILRIRGYDSNRREGRVVCTMYVIHIRGCRVCGATNWPDTDLVIPGTSFGSMLRRIVQSYHEAHVVEADMKNLLNDLENADFSKGTISNCVSAIAARLNASPVCIPAEEPIRICDDLREYRSPVRPRPASDTDFGEQDAVLTCRSNVWTSFMTQPVMVHVRERANMDPWASTDESPNHIGGEDVQTLVSLTIHTAMIHIARHRDAVNLRRKHDWMIHRHGMRDGTKGFEWCLGACCRCCVHIGRKPEDFAMNNGIGSQEYIRHVMLQEIYGDLKRIGEEVERRAGGPIRCASQLGIIRRIPGLAEYVRTAQAHIVDRLNMLIESFPRDGFTTTLENARYDMVRPAEVPGMLFQNNPTEGEIRDDVVPDKRRYRFPNEKAAQNHSIIRSYTATCRRNGISPFEASVEMGKDRRFDIFNVGIPPPIFG